MISLCKSIILSIVSVAGNWKFHSHSRAKLKIIKNKVDPDLVYAGTLSVTARS